MIAIRYLISLFFIFSTFPVVTGQNDGTIINDGPYIFKSGNSFKALWVNNGNLQQRKINRRNFNVFRTEFNLAFDYHDLVAVNFIKPDFTQVFNHVDSIAAISDIHGAYEKYISLLKSQGVIDQNLEWQFGTGHLVVLGDIFDRGNKVTEIFWHLFGLEKQARMAGGEVHVILGNHEIMDFSGDLQYTNPKYLHVAKVAGVRYPDLYSGNSVLGKWLRYKPVMATIDNFLFVHAGISRELTGRDISIAEINRLFFQMLVKSAVESQNDIRNLILLTEDNGPLWYRGFFEDHTFTENTADSILKYYGIKSVVVGHTTFEGIRPLFHNKIIGIDAGLGEGKQGAMLIIKGDALYRCTNDGKRQRF